MYHEQYPAHEVQQRAPRPQREAYKSEGAFDGTTTSRSAYMAHPIPPRTVSLASPMEMPHQQWCGPMTNRSC